MRSNPNGHAKGHMTGHLHRALAYGLVSVAGLIACALVLRAHMEVAAIGEEARLLEASVSSILTR